MVKIGIQQIKTKESSLSDSELRTQNSRYNLLMLSGDNSIARGVDSTFYQMLALFSQYWQRIDILTPTAPDATTRTLHENVFVHPAPYHRARQPQFIAQKGAQLLQERPYHLIVSHDFGFFYNGIGALWLLRNHDMPLVSEIHHIEGYPQAVNLREWLWLAAAKVYLPIIGKRADAVRVVNQTMKRDLVSFGVPVEKIRVLSSLYLDLEQHQPRVIDKHYDVLFVGRLASNKGIMLLLEAIAQVRLTHPQVTLAIRGEGNLRSQIDRYIQQRKLHNTVRLLPRQEDMPTLYNQARMLVCASTVEGNPRVTIEAMACGVPVISTRVGIMPDVITQGDNGYLVDWDAHQIAQTIRLLLDNPRLRMQIGAAGEMSVQQYAAEKTIRDYALAYHALI